MFWALLDVALVLVVVLIFNAVKWVYDYVRQMRKMRALPVPGFKGFPVLGLIPLLIKSILSCPNHIPTNAYLFPIGMGMHRIFSKKGIFRLDGGWFKQVFVVCNKEWAEAVMNDPNEQKKSPEYRIVSEFTGSGLLTASYSLWKKHRRVLLPAFSPRIVDSFQHVMYEHSSLMVQRIESTIGKGSVNVENELSQCTLGIVTETVLGLRNDKSKEHEAYLEAVRKVLALLAKKIITPWLWVDAISWITPTGRELKANLRIVHTFVEKIVQKKKLELESVRGFDPLETGPMVKRRPFLELMLLHNVHCRPEDVLTDQEIQDETHTITFAGFDTISVTTSWVVYYLGLYPEVMKKAWDEVHALVGEDRQRPIELEDLRQMDYMERVIKAA